jgi:hypothetical protein
MSYVTYDASASMSVTGRKYEDAPLFQVPLSAGIRYKGGAGPGSSSPSTSIGIPSPFTFLTHHVDCSGLYNLASACASFIQAGDLKGVASVACDFDVSYPVCYGMLPVTWIGA